jgi:hypothetical protein
MLHDSKERNDGESDQPFAHHEDTIPFGHEIMRQLSLQAAQVRCQIGMIGPISKSAPRIHLPTLQSLGGYR